MPPVDVETLLALILGGLFTLAGVSIQSRSAHRLADRRASDLVIENARAVLLDADKLFRSSRQSEHSYKLRPAVEEALPGILADLRMQVGYMTNRRLRRDMDFLIDVLWDCPGVLAVPVNDTGELARPGDVVDVDGFGVWVLRVDAGHDRAMTFEPAFGIYLTGHDSVGDHELTFTPLHPRRVRLRGRLRRRAAGRSTSARWYLLTLSARSSE